MEDGSLLACGHDDRIAIIGHGEAWMWTQSPQCVGTQPLERKWRRATVGWRRSTTEWQDADKDEEESAICVANVGCATHTP